MNDMFDYMTPFTEFYMNLKPIYKIGFFVFLYVFFKFVSYIRSSYDVNSKRRETPCEFVDGITEEQFKSLVYYFADKTPRLKNITVSGPVVIGEIISQTRKTTWIFRIDFNDYGHITGRYWLMNGNYQSRIPRRLASNISEGVIYYLNGDKTKGRSRRLRNARRSSWFKQKRIEIAPFVAFFSVAAFICLGLYGWHIYREWKFIHPPISCYDMISMNYEDLTKKLVDAGFTNITYVPDEDLVVGWMSKDGDVSDVSIGGKNFFGINSYFKSDDEVVITYHTFPGNNTINPEAYLNTLIPEEPSEITTNQNDTVINTYDSNEISDDLDTNDNDIVDIDIIEDFSEYDYAYYYLFFGYSQYCLIDTDKKVVCWINTDDYKKRFGEYEGDENTEIVIYYSNVEPDVIIFENGIGYDAVITNESKDIKIDIVSVPVSDALHYL